MLIKKRVDVISFPPLFTISGLLPLVYIIFIIFSIQFFCSSYHSLFFFLVFLAIDVVILASFYLWLLRLFLISSGRLMILLDLFIFFRFKIWSENVIAIFCSSHKHFSIIGMETKFLYIVLSLMQEHKLWRDIIRSWWRLFFIYFDWEVPDG